MLVVQNVTHDAEKAKDKKAALGTDVVIENFTTEDINAFDVIDDLKDIDKKTFEKLCGMQATLEEVCAFFDVCIDNALGVSHDLTVYYSTDTMSFTGNAYLTFPWSQTWKFKRSTNERLYQSIFLKDFYNYCIADIKRSIGRNVLKLVEQQIVNVQRCQISHSYLPYCFSVRLK